MTHISPTGVEILGHLEPGYRDILSHEALSFVAGLHRRFEKRRQSLLRYRKERQAELDQGAMLLFPHETADIRASEWKVRPAPADLLDRRVEITGPVDRKMVVNALNSGAKCFMADFEDATAPLWTNLIEGQINLRDANKREIDFTDERSGKQYSINDDAAVLIVRPRGWHLDERHVLVNGQALSGSLFDFGLYLFHNHEALKNRQTGPYFYLPKLESRYEARLWSLVFQHAEDELGLERGTIRATVLIETIPATFELDEILYELKEHVVGLNCGRWDYIFSYIKRLRNNPECILPDRGAVTMSVPFMEAYSKRVIEVCHRRGAHAMGGMSAFIPVKNDEAANEAAREKVRQDKQREVTNGHDGTWVAHPDLVPVAKAVFDARMKGSNQLDFEDEFALPVTTKALLEAPEGDITDAGVEENIDVAIRYIAAWLGGRGAVPIRNLMEDAATAEIARAQLWQWRKYACTTAEGRTITAGLLEAEVLRIREGIKTEVPGQDELVARIDQAADILSTLILDEEFAEFLTLPAYDLITADLKKPMQLTEFED
ncbi:MAG: malate synthase A [Maricaulis sp.]|uniref:malate synthase A n=1 Tax=Maricaulis sp. TaxID=1486257 RepID=UPI001B08C71A|nr:malate synthase A [Maricaulis sp.]MBO6730103.1 malate synthase A [Maricaulis sp.]MBO6847371.1 malate synthase A [Maricaulis sp.]MBO6876429.1 malate synthase A [Maricaulis sp.]MDM7983084.1 malate synthase A [Maricaulis sp.]